MELLLFLHFFRETLFYFRTRRTAKIITAILFLALAAAVGAALFFFFVQGFRSVADDPYFREALMLYILEVFFLVVSFLVFTGSIMTSFVVFFRRPQDVWIFSSPGFSHHAHAAILRVLISSSWPLLLVAVPGVLAINEVFDLSPAGVLGAFLAVILLSGVAALGGTLLVFAAAGALSIVPRWSRARLTIRSLAVSVAAACILVSLAAWRRASAPDLVALFRAGDLDRAAADPARIAEVFSFFPSHAAARALTSFLSGDAATAVYMLLILLTVVAGFLGAFLVSARSHLFFWTLLSEGEFFARARDAEPRSREAPVGRARFSHGVPHALLLKELLGIVRNGRSVLWIGFLFFLWFLQTGLNVVLARIVARAEFDIALAGPLAAALQFATMVFFVAAFALRFAFPSFSTERATIWILGSAPLDFGKVFRVKFAFFGIFFLLCGGWTAVFQAAILDFPLMTSVAFLGFFAAAILFLAAAALSMGALFPNFDTDDPEVLATSLPGLAFVAGALLYGIVSTAALYAFLSAGVLGSMVMLIILTIVATALLVAAVPAALRRREFRKIIA